MYLERKLPSRHREQMPYPRTVQLGGLNHVVPNASTLPSASVSPNWLRLVRMSIDAARGVAIPTTTSEL